MSLKVGDKAPNFKSVNQKGEDIELKNYLGKKVILYFYPRDMTPGCTTESIEFNANLSKIKKLGYDLVGVSRDSLKSHNKFIKN